MKQHFEPLRPFGYLGTLQNCEPERAVSPDGDAISVTDFAHVSWRGPVTRRVETRRLPVSRQCTKD